MPANMLFLSLYYDILSLTSLKVTQEFHLLLGFVENQTVFWDFKIRNSVRITEGLDNGESDNRGPTVLGNPHARYIQVRKTVVFSSVCNLCHDRISVNFW